MRSYTRTDIGAVARLREARALFDFHKRSVEDQIRSLLSDMKATEAVLEGRLDQPLRGKKILEIGPGQRLRQARYFGAANDVYAVDLDEIILSFGLGAWLRTLRSNGPVRFGKTLARKALGIDRRFLAELDRQMGYPKDRNISVLRRDASDTGFPDDFFDCAVSFSVLEHIPDPRAVLRETRRVLRRGGVSHHIVHIYSSDSGAHDARSFSLPHPDLPYWCHLRSGTGVQAAPNTFVNRISLQEWRTIASEELPGVEISSIRQDHVPELKRALSEIRDRQELTEFSDEELMTACVALTWKKPD